MRTKDERRLDSVARFLERNHLCAAVTVFEGKLLYATNLIYKGSSKKDGSKSVTIEKSQKALELITKEKFDRDGEDGDLFAQIVLDCVKSVIQKGIMVLDNCKIKSIARNFLKEDGISEWKNKTMQQLSEEYKTPFELSNAVLIGSIAERLITDLLKARQEFQIDDFEKSLLKKGMTVELVSAKKKGIHAEMTLLDHMIEISDKKDSSLSGIYIGVSKKCCANCSQVIEAVNNALPTVTLNLPITIYDAEERLSNSVDLEISSENEVDSSFTSVEVSPIKVSGVHPQKSEKWEKPDFLTRSNGKNCEKIKKSYEEIIKAIEVVNTERNLRYDMAMERSPSPPPVPSSVFEPIDQVKNLGRDIENKLTLTEK